MTHRNKKLFIAAATVLACSSGCGERKSAKVGAEAPALASSQTKSGATPAASAASSCTKESCATATMDVSAEGKTDTGLFVGVVGEPVPWSFTGVAAEDGREVAILLNNVPKGAELDPPQDGTPAATSVRVNWTAAVAQTSKSDIQIYARDKTRCLAIEGSEKACAANKVN